MNLEEAVLDLEAAILEATGRVEEDVNEELKALAGQILGRMLGGGTPSFENRTGALRQSMFASVSEDNTLSIGMLYYGYFLSFGVLPRRAEGLPVEVAPQFGVSEGYKFARRDNGRFKKGGIAARQFYPTDIDDRIETIIANVIQKVEV